MESLNELKTTHIIGSVFMNDNRTKNLIYIFLLVSTISVYSQVQDHEFINCDDDIYVTENSIV